MSVVGGKYNHALESERKREKGRTEVAYGQTLIAQKQQQQQQQKSTAYLQDKEPSNVTESRSIIIISIIVCSMCVCVCVPQHSSPPQTEKNVTF